MHAFEKYTIKVMGFTTLLHAAHEQKQQQSNKKSMLFNLVLCASSETESVYFTRRLKSDLHISSYFTMLLRPYLQKVKKSPSFLRVNLEAFENGAIYHLVFYGILIKKAIPSTNMTV